jgi:hypothetical protein
MPQPDSTQRRFPWNAPAWRDPGDHTALARECDPEQVPPSTARNDAERWVAVLPFSAEELEDTWPNLVPPYEDET